VVSSLSQIQSWQSVNSATNSGKLATPPLIDSEVTVTTFAGMHAAIAARNGSLAIIVDADIAVQSTDTVLDWYSCDTLVIKASEGNHFTIDGTGLNLNSFSAMFLKFHGGDLWIEELTFKGFTAERGVCLINFHNHRDCTDASVGSHATIVRSAFKDSKALEGMLQFNNRYLRAHLCDCFWDNIMPGWPSHVKANNIGLLTSTCSGGGVNILPNMGPECRVGNGPYYLTPPGASYDWNLNREETCRDFLLCSSEMPIGGSPSGYCPTATFSLRSQVSGVTAKGDPHLQNIHGEKFDLMKPGRHVLLYIPRAAAADATLLRVSAEAQKLGRRCEDIYFQELNITGKWAETQKPNGFVFRAAEAGCNRNSSRMRFDQLDLKVVHGCTSQGVAYLNFHVKHIGRIGLVIGGLLGEDDHTEEATPSNACVRQISLERMS